MGTPAQFVEQAMLSGFQQGEQLKQQKKDEEHNLKITDLINQRQQLAAKMPSLQEGLSNLTPGTPEYDQATTQIKSAHDALQKVNLDIADAYHPTKNPGAIQKFGHLLTDHVGLTSPEKRAAQTASQQQAKTTAASAATEQQIAAQPLTASQLDTQKKQALIGLIRKSDLSPEDQKEAIANVLGVKNKPLYKPFDLPNGGGTVWLDATRQDLIPPGATLHQTETADMRKREDYAAEKKKYDDAHPNGPAFPTFEKWAATESQRPSTSAINEGLDSYAKSHGFGTFSEIPNEYRDVVMNYEIRKQALDKAYGSSATTTKLPVNFQGQIIPVTVTSYKTPQGVESLKDPLWFLAAGTPTPEGEAKRKAGVSSGQPTTEATPTTAAPPTTSGTPKAPSAKELKKQAAGIAPPGSSTGQQPASSTKSSGVGASSNIKIGNPLFAGKNKMYDDAITAYNSAESRRETMDKNAKEAYGGDQQAMLSLVANHIGMTLGAQKGARINQAVWNEAVESAPVLGTVMSKVGHFEANGDYVFDGEWKKGVTLTGPQIKSMVKLAHEQVDTLGHNVTRIETELNKGVSNPAPSQVGGGEDQSKKPPKGATHKKKYQGKYYYVDNEGNNLGEVPQ